MQATELGTELLVNNFTVIMQATELGAGLLVNNFTVIMQATELGAELPSCWTVLSFLLMSERLSILYGHFFQSPGGVTSVGRTVLAHWKHWDGTVPASLGVFKSKESIEKSCRGPGCSSGGGTQVMLQISPVSFDPQGDITLRCSSMKEERDEMKAYCLNTCGENSGNVECCVQVAAVIQPLASHIVIDVLD